MDLDLFREQLVVWGITPNVLFFIGVVSIITLFFSIRIVMKWYLGIQHVQDELREVRKQLMDIQNVLATTAVKVETPKEQVSLETLEELPATSTKKAKDSSFRLLNH